jgi:hypothetical protein
MCLQRGNYIIYGGYDIYIYIVYGGYDIYIVNGF